MNNIAGSLAELGRYAEAVALFEKTLAFRMRILPENHPDLGERHMATSALHVA
jgi:hypothetical protein